MNHLPRLLALCLYFALVLAGCSEDGSDDVDNGIPALGTFAVEVSGDLSLNITGSANAGQVGATWGLTLADYSAEEYSSIGFLHSGGTRPGEGTYSVGGVGPAAGDLYGSAFISGQNFSSTGGTLTVTSSSATNVRGTLSLTMAAGTVGSPTNITITGGFNATNFDTF